MCKFRLLILLGFLCSGCAAQYKPVFDLQDWPLIDLFESEGVVKLENIDIETMNTIGSHVIDVVDANLNTAIGIENNFGDSYYLIQKHVQPNGSISTNVDSVVALLKNGDAEDIYKFTDPLYRDTAGTLKNFFKLNKQLNGNLLMLDVEVSYRIFLKKPKRDYFARAYKATFAKASGFLYLFFRLSDSGQLGFAKMVFIPFDNQTNVFADVIAANDLQLIKSKDFNSLENRFTPRFAEMIKKRVGHLEKQIGKLEIAKKAFTYRSYLRSGKLYFLPTFRVNREDKAVTIRYLLDGKRFLIDWLAVRDTKLFPKDD